jgi:hypothetical protein
MATLKATITGAGHTVLPNGAISAGALAGMDVFVVGEAGAGPSAGELTDLLDWITGGGILLVMFDSACSGCGGGNPLLAGVGTAMSAGGTAGVAPFAGGIFASEGPPFDIVGDTLDTTPGTAISGGAALAGSYIHYQGLGSGWVFAFGDRSDHNFFVPSASNVNGKLFLNIVEGGGGGGGGVVPEPSSLALFLVGAGTLLAFRRRR